MTWLWLLMPAIVMAAPAEGGRSEFRAQNGLRVILDERHDRSVLRLFLLTLWDRATLSDIQADHALQIHSVLERCGAGGLSRPAFDRRLADRGIRLNLNSASDSLCWSMLSDSQDQDDAFELLGHMVFRPALGEDSLQGRKEVTAAARPEELFRATLGFPSEGVFPNNLGVEERFSLHRRLVRPEQSVLVIQGDLSLAQARQSVMLHFGTWSPTPGKAISEMAPPPLAPPKTWARSGAGGGIWAGSPAPICDARVRAAHIAVAILLSRSFRDDLQTGIFLEVSRPGGDAGPLLFGVGPDQADPKKHLQSTLEDLCRRGFGAGDLAFVRSTWQAERAALTLHPEDQLAAIAQVALKGDPGNYVLDLKIEEINAALRARLDPAALRWF